MLTLLHRQNARLKVLDFSRAFFFNFSQSSFSQTQIFAVLNTMGCCASTTKTHTVDNLATPLHAKGKFAEAELLYDLAISTKNLGPEHPSVAAALSNLALLLKAQGKYAEAEPLYRRALAIREKLGPDQLQVATTLNNLSRLLEAQGKYAEAKPMSHRALVITLSQKQLGSDHSWVASSPLMLQK